MKKKTKIVKENFQSIFFLNFSKSKFFSFFSKINEIRETKYKTKNIIFVDSITKKRVGKKMKRKKNSNFKELTIYS